MRRNESSRKEEKRRTGEKTIDKKREEKRALHNKIADKNI